MCCPHHAHCRLSTVKHCLTPEQVHQLAATTHGYVGADLAALVNEAAMGALRRHIHLKQRQHQQVPGADALPSQQQQPLQQQQQPHLLQQQQQPASLCVCWEDVAAARLLVKPSALREVAVEVPQVGDACCLALVCIRCCSMKDIGKPTASVPICGAQLIVHQARKPGLGLKGIASHLTNIGHLQPPNPNVCNFGILSSR